MDRGHSPTDNERHHQKGRREDWRSYGAHNRELNDAEVEDNMKLHNQSGVYRSKCFKCRLPRHFEAECCTKKANYKAKVEDINFCKPLIAKEEVSLVRTEISEK